MASTKTLKTYIAAATSNTASSTTTGTYQTHTTSYGYDWARGLVLTVTDANNISTYYGYDAFGRLTSVTQAGESAPTIKYGYPTGSTISAPFAITTETRIDPYTSPAYQRAWTLYDGLGRAIQTQAQAESNWLVVQNTAYDARGLAVTVTLPYTQTGTGGTYQTPNWSVRSITKYDALGRATQITAPDGMTTTHAYRDWREIVLDANGHQTQSEKDGLVLQRKVSS